MRSKTLIRCRRYVLIAFFTCATIAAGLAILRYTLLWRPSLESVAAQANQLIAAAGGPAKILKEADEIFALAGVSEDGGPPPDGRYQLPYISPYEMKTKYPALAALGKEYGVLVCMPTIRIHFGRHNSGFIEIWPVKRPTMPGEVDLFDSRIFVR